MPKLKDIFDFGNSKYAVLHDPSREVIAAYQTANRFLDTAQEYVLIEQGLKHFSRIIHNQAHELPKRFDAFADMLHERHLMAEYPATEELNWREEFTDIDGVFDFIIRVFDSIHDALEKFRAATDNAEFRPMALFAEELMAQNSADYTKFLEIWARYDNEGGSLTSFDGWCKEFLESEDK